MRARVIFASGWAHPKEVFEDLVARLEPRYEVSVLDPDPEKFLSALERAAGGGKALLAGWSLGAMLSIEAAARRPDLVRGLLVISGTPRFGARGDSPRSQDLARLRVLRASLRKDPRASLARFYEECAAPCERLPGKPRPEKAPSLDALEAGLEYLSRADLRPACSRVMVPCRVVHGAEDRIVPVEAGRWLAAHIPGAAYREVPGCGHDLPLRFPQVVAQELAALEAEEPLDARDVATRFSRAARTYEARARVQRETAERLAELLGGFGEPSRILEVGCGTGFFTAVLLERFPLAAIDALDLSEGMLAVARGKFPSEQRVRWIVCDARRFRSELRYDLVASSASLHWLAPLGPSLSHLAGLLETGGRMVGALMLEGTLAELHEIRRRVAPHKAPPGKLPSEGELRSALVESGLSLERFEVESHSALCPSAQALLEELRLEGLTGGGISRAPQLLGRAELRRLTEEYEASYGVEGGIVATYRTGYFRARKLE